MNEGAAVRVSLIGFGAISAPDRASQLNGIEVDAIHADLTATVGADLSRAKALLENTGVSFIGTQKGGSFDIEGATAREWLQIPNPHGTPNSAVVRPWCNGSDLVRRPSGKWIIDFGCDMSKEDASLFETPFQHAQTNVLPARIGVKRDNHRLYWWLHAEDRPGMRKALNGLRRYVATARVAKHRLFVWIAGGVLPDCQVVVVAREDDTTFGVLHSRLHELWALRLGTSLEDRPRYTPTTTFETFPFPAGMTPADTAAGAPTGLQAEAIAAAARRLNDLRENWLNPAEWIDRVPEVVPCFPDRIIPKPGHEAELKKRTLTNLYNLRPTWLDSAHKALDAAVAAAYGWTDYTPEMPDDEILRRLLALNLERAREAAAVPIANVE